MVPKVSVDHKRTVQDKILNSAEILFSEKGYYATSMDEIVSKSGFSKGAIYSYFTSKEDLFLALQEKQLASSLEQLEALFEPSDSALTKLEKALEMIFESQSSCTKEDCRMVFEFWVVAPRIQTLQKRIDERFKKGHKFVTSIINEGIRNGEFEDDIDADSVTSIMLASLDGLSLHWTFTSQEFEWKRIKDTFIHQVLLKVLGAKSNSLRISKTKISNGEGNE
jgi:AcrR family transcriptional regulator